MEIFCLSSFIVASDRTMTMNRHGAAVAGEVVSGYSLRLKRESSHQHLWVNAYSNDDPCYIATRKMILEGGYEVVQSMDIVADFMS